MRIRLGQHSPLFIAVFSIKAAFQIKRRADLARLCKGILIMVAPRKSKKIFCTIVRVTENQGTENGHPSRFSTRPSRLLPWADPYIAKLVRNLQDEVREELRTGRSSDSDLKADLDPLPATDPDGGWTEDTRWTPWDDTGFDSH